MCAAAAAVVLIRGIEVIARGTEGQSSNVTRCGWIAVTAVAGTGRFEGTALGVVTVAVETAAVRVSRFYLAGKVVLGLGVADLAETAVVGRVDEPSYGICVRNVDGSGVEPGSLELGPDHGQVGCAVWIVAGLAKHVCRAKGGEVSAHIPECRDDSSRSIVAGGTLSISVGEGQANVIAEYARYMCRVGVMTTVAGQSTGEG